MVIGFLILFDFHLNLNPQDCDLSTRKGQLQNELTLGCIFENARHNSWQMGNIQDYYYMYPIQSSCFYGSERSSISSNKQI